MEVLGTVLDHEVQQVERVDLILQRAPLQLEVLVHVDDSLGVGLEALEVALLQTLHDHGLEEASHQQLFRSGLS